MNRHQSYRKTARTTLRRPFRSANRRCLRGRRRGPNDFSQALTAFRRAIRAHRRLARLAPSFFDAAVIERERENRAEQRRWMALWEPHIAKAYGVAPEPVSDRVDWPLLPPPRIQRAVDSALADLQLWLAAGSVAMERHQQRNPHALPTWTQMARHLDLAFDLKKMVLGLDSPNKLPDKITYDYEFTDLKRAYGHLLNDPMPLPNPATGTASDPNAKPGLGSQRADSQNSVEPEAAHSIESVPKAVVDPPCDGNAAGDVGAALPDGNPPAPPRRCDAWSRWARQMRRHGGFR